MGTRDTLAIISEIRFMRKMFGEQNQFHCNY